MKQLILMCAALSLIAISGCGGGGSRETTGRMTVTMTWPERTRLVPDAANTVKVELFDGTDERNNRIAFQVINRPFAQTDGKTTAQATFEGLPVANLLLKATAYPQDPGDAVNPSVVAQATGQTVVSIQPGDNNPPVNLTMNSTIDRINVTSTFLTVNSAPGTLTATAVDAAGNVVLVTPAKLQWQSNLESVATVTNAGVVSAVSPGFAVITVRDTESNKTGSGTVTVSNEGGTANVTVNNPPTGTRSVRIEIRNAASQIVSTRNLAWTTGTTINDSVSVPAGTHTVTATAFSQADGGGSPLGDASGQVTVPSLQSGSVTLNIESDVLSIALVPANPTVIQGQSVTLSVQATIRDVVAPATLVSAAFNWETIPTPSAIATVDAGGVVSTANTGTIAVRATDPRTAQSAQTNVTATPNTASAGGVVR